MTSSVMLLSLIRIDGGTQTRAHLDEKVVAEYADAFKSGSAFPPVVVFFDGSEHWLADGFHRYHASKAAGFAEIQADVRVGTKRDAVLFSVGANAAHGLRRTNDDKRQAVMRLLQDEEWGKWNDKEIAKRCGVHRELVGKVRASLVVDQQVSAPRTYITKHGTPSTMNTAKIGMGIAGSREERVKQIAELAEQGYRSIQIAPVRNASDQRIAELDGELAKLRERYADLQQANERLEDELKEQKAINERLTALTDGEAETATFIKQLQKRIADSERYTATLKVQMQGYQAEAAQAIRQARMNTKELQKLRKEISVCSPTAGLTHH